MDKPQKWSDAVNQGWPMLEVLEDGVAVVSSGGAVLRCNSAFRQLVGRERLRSAELAGLLLEQCQAGERAGGKWEEVMVALQGQRATTLRRLAIALEGKAEAPAPGWILVLKDASGEAAVHEKFRQILADERKARRNIKIVFASAAMLFAIASGSVARAYHVVYKKYELPLPAIARATTPEALSRGEKIFTSVCAGCHVAGADLRMVGVQLQGLGTVASANVSSDATGGVGAWADAEIARTIRSGVRRDGQPALGMPGYPDMGDDDVAAVIGFMRSPHEFFAPDPQIRPRPTLTFEGMLLMAYRVGVDPRVRSDRIDVPPKAPTAEYGRYMADAVYRCWDCHTEGLDGDKRQRPGAYAGGFEFADEQGRPIYSTNLTFDDTGLGKWTLVDFSRAVRDGVGPDGFIVQPPMQRFRFIDNEEMEAIFKYLHTLPAVNRPNQPGGAPMSKPAPSARPEELYAQLGCRLCHGWQPPFDARVRQAATRPVSWVASWIRNPQQFKPGTQMPTFAELLDDSQALALAEWLQKSSQVKPRQ